LPLKRATARATGCLSRVAVAGKVYDLQMPVFTNGRFTQSSMEVLRRSMIELGLLATVPPDDVLYTERFLPQA